MIAEMIELTLTNGRYGVRDAPDLRQATTLLDEWRPQVVIADMELVGEGLLQHLSLSAESGGTRLPVLGLTRRGDLKTKLAAFDQGVDDIMTVPFSPEELLARVLVITRRTYGQAPALNPIIKAGDIEIDILHRRARIQGEELHLTPVEQSLLYLLAAHAGRVVTRGEILDTVWGTDFVAESNMVDRHVRALRSKHQNDWRKPRFVATVPGRGYRFLPVVNERRTRG